MEFDVYVSTKNRSKFVFVRRGSDVSTHNLGKSDAELSELSMFKTVRSTPGQPVIGADLDEIACQIEKQGFALHSAKAGFTEGTKR